MTRPGSIGAVADVEGAGKGNYALTNILAGAGLQEK